MFSRIADAAERVKYLPALFGSGVSFLAAAAAAGAASPDHQTTAALAVLIPGVGAALLNEFHKSFHDSNDEQKALRNHLIRRGMAQALSDALVRAKTSFGEEVPPDLRESFFHYWPDILARAQKDDELIELLFPLEHTEDQWSLLNRYCDDLGALNQSSLPSEQEARFRQRENLDQQTLASLLRSLPVKESDAGIIRLFGQNLSDCWPQDAALSFAVRLLPLYRLSFAALFSEGGPVSDAIDYKNQKFTRQQLEIIQFQLQAGMELLDHRIEGVSGQLSGIDCRIEKIETMLAALLEQRTKSGEVPEGAITSENRQAKIEEIASEIPKVVEELKRSSSLVASSDVKTLLATGQLDEAVKAGQAQFDVAREAYSESGRDFARASYDMGRINEVGFRWAAALENYRQAWELTGRKQFEYGAMFARLAWVLNLPQEAMTAYKVLTSICTNPEQAALMFNNLGNLYSMMHRYPEAEAAYAKALALYRKLAAKDPAEHEADVAMTLNNLAALFANTRREKKAEQTYTEALALHRKLVASDPAEHEHDLAATLNNLAVLYSDIQQDTKAEVAYAEALAFRRKLAGANPALQAELAETLHNFAILKRKTGRRTEAEMAFTEALTLHRKLATVNPAAFERRVAATLNSLAILYLEMERQTEAEAAFTDAINLYRKLAVVDPTTYEPDLSQTLNSIAIFYMETQRQTEAEAAYTEALSLYRKLAAVDPTTYEPNLSQTLNSLGDLFSYIQQHTKAETAYTEALVVQRKLAGTNPVAFESGLAETLHNLGDLYLNTQRHSDAEKAFIEALTIRRRLASGNPAIYEPEVATTLKRLGFLCLDTQQYAAAERAYMDALAILRKLAAADPATYEPEIGMTLNSLGILHWSAEQHNKAEMAYSEALNLYRKLAAINPAEFEPHVAWTLNNLAAFYSDAQRQPEAERAYTEGLSLYRKLAAANPAVFERYVKRMLKMASQMSKKPEAHWPPGTRAEAHRVVRLVENLWRYLRHRQ